MDHYLNLVVLFKSDFGLLTVVPLNCVTPVGLNLLKSRLADQYPPFLKYCLVILPPLLVMWGTLCESDLYNALPAIHATLATIGATLLILCLSLRDCLPIHISKIKKR